MAVRAQAAAAAAAAVTQGKIRHKANLTKNRGVFPQHRCPAAVANAVEFTNNGGGKRRRAQESARDSFGLNKKGHR